MDYIGELSNPKLKHLVYYCSSCETLYSFRPFPLYPGKWGVAVTMKSRLKRAGFLDNRPLDRPSSKGVSLVGPPKAQNKGVNLSL